MSMIKIDYSKCCWKGGKCDSCSGAGCVEACPVGVLARKKIIEIDNSKCLDCGVCILACKHQAISMV